MTGTVTDLPGGDVEVEDIPATRPGSPPLVLLHEGLGSISTWKDVPARLADMTGRRVVTYSRSGYGGSSPAPLPRRPGYMHFEAEVVLPALRERMGLGAPVLVGHSDGASIALIHAAGAGAVSAVVAMAPHAFVEECTLEGARAARRSYLGGDLRRRLSRHHADVDGAFFGWNDIWLSPDFRDWSIEDRLPGVEAPVLLVQCRDDPYGTLAQLDRIRSGVAGPVERLLFEAGGHSPQLSHPEEVLDAVAGFSDRFAGRCTSPVTGRAARSQSAGEDAAVDGQRHPGDVGGGVAGQEDHRS